MPVVCGLFAAIYSYLPFVFYVKDNISKQPINK